MGIDFSKVIQASRELDKLRKEMQEVLNRKNGPHLLAMLVPGHEGVELAEFFRCLLGENARMVQPQGLMRMMAQHPLVVDDANALPKAAQEELVKRYTQRDQPVIVFVVSVDPGDLMQNKLWTKEFRMAVYRTFRWPLLHERGVRNAQRFFEATLAAGGFTCAPNVFEPITATDLKTIEGTQHLLEIANQACYTCAEASDSDLVVKAEHVLAAMNAPRGERSSATRLTKAGEKQKRRLAKSA